MSVTAGWGSCPRWGSQEDAVAFTHWTVFCSAGQKGQRETSVEDVTGQCVVRTTMGEGFLKAPGAQEGPGLGGECSLPPPPVALLPFSQMGGICLSSPSVPSPGFQAAPRGTHVLSILPGPGVRPALSREHTFLETLNRLSSLPLSVPCHPLCRQRLGGTERVVTVRRPVQELSGFGLCWPHERPASSPGEAAPTGACQVSRPGHCGRFGAENLLL